VSNHHHDDEPRAVRVSGDDTLSVDAWNVGFSKATCENPDCEDGTHTAVFMMVRVRASDPARDAGVVKQICLALTPHEALHLATDLDSAAREVPCLAW